MISPGEFWSLQEPVLVMAAVLDAYMKFSGRLQDWRAATAEWWVGLQLIHWPQRHEISQRFLEITYAIYGRKMLSWRRVFSSCTSSLLLTFVFFFLILRLNQILFGIGDVDYNANYVVDFLGHTGGSISYSNPLYLISVAYDCVGFNFIPDFISLAETCWVIKLAAQRKYNLFFLFFIDFVFTTFIWVVAHLIAFVYSSLILGIDLAPLLNNYDADSVPILAYVATTYSTSLIWFVFLFTLLIVSAAKRASSFAVALFESKWVVELPIFLFVGVICLVSWPIYFLLKFAV